jgi:hypothetical protein
MRAVRFRLDHLVVVVDALTRAAEHFRAAGFTVSPGGRHDGIPTENALVAFADGSYLELLAMREPGARAELRALRASDRWDAHLKGVSALARRFLPRLAGADGVGDACLLAGHLDRFAGEARRRSLVLAGPVAMQRERRDEPALEWHVLLPADDLVPFLIEDRTPREWRVPGGPEATTHANGATGIADVRLRAHRTSAGALRLAELFDAAPRALPGGRTAVEFAGARWWIEDGEQAGACGCGIAGVAALPDDVRALGIVPAEAA